MKRAFTAYPYLVWAALFIIAPLILVLYYGFTVPGAGRRGCVLA